MQKRNDLASDAEYQRRKMMSTDEKATQGRDRIAGQIHEQNQRDGKNTTFDQAFKEASRVAEKWERQRK